MEIIAFGLCIALMVLIVMALINYENNKEFKLSKENMEQFEVYENRLSDWAKGNYNPIINTEVRFIDESNV